MLRWEKRSARLGAGFTMIEILVVLGVTAILGTVGFLAIPAYRAQNTLDLAVQQTVAYVRQAQQKAVSGQQGKPWGVHAVAAQNAIQYYDIFYGASYATGTTTQRVTLPGQVHFVDPVQGTTKDIIFSTVTGTPASADTIAFVSTFSSGIGEYIAVAANGLVSYTKAAATIPGSPALSASLGANSVTLTWTTPANNGSAISAYKIYRGTSSGSETLLTTVGRVLTYTDAGIGSGNMYYYRISAVNAIGEGPFSNEVNAGPPSAPLTVGIIAGNTQLSLSWQAPANNGGGTITNYKIYRGTSSGGEVLLTTVGNVLAYMDTGLTNATTYYYEIAAVNVAGSGVLSSESSGMPVGQPGAPQTVAAAGSNSHMTLTWQVPTSNGGSAITNYKIYRGTSSGSETLLTTAGNVLTYTDSTVVVGNGYYYKVSAVNAVGEGMQSSEAYGTMYMRVFVTNGNYNGNLGGLTGADALCQSSASAAGLSGTWKAWLSDGSMPALQRIAAPTNTTIPYRLITGTTIATNWSDLTSGALATGIGITETGATRSNISVWTNTDQAGGIATGNHCSNWSTSSQGWGRSGIVPTFIHSYDWTTFSDNGCNALQPLYCFEQFTEFPPSAPTGVSAIQGSADNQITLTWAVPSYSGGSAITNYKIYRGTSSGGETLLTTVGNMLTYADLGLSYSTKYYYKVTAVNSYGEGPQSSEVNATTLAGPKRIFITNATYNGNLGGLGGADTKCQSAATAASLGGTWKAWLSDGSTSASSRLAHSTGRYTLVNGTVVANNWTGLTSGTLLASINMTESGGTNNGLVWTNTNTNGSIYGTTANSHCSSWSQPGNGYSGMSGWSGSTSSLWTVYTPFNCGNSFALYCVEQ